MVTQSSIVITSRFLLSKVQIGSGNTFGRLVNFSEGWVNFQREKWVNFEREFSKFEHIIIGGSIRGMVTSKELQEYLNKNKSLLSAKIRGLFAVCGNMRKPVEPQQTTMFIDDHLAKLCEVNNVPSKIFLGRITKSLMDPQTAKMMESMEDYDNLKRFDCMAFGHEILSKITNKE